MKHSFKKQAIKGVLGAMAFGLTSCTGIDCPLDTVVVWTMTFYDSQAETTMNLPCVLTVDAAGAGTLYNKGTAIASMELPMSIASPTDTLYLHFSADDLSTTDTLYIDHTNFAHFEAMDCPGSVFHNITSTHFTTHSMETFPVVIDSVSIIRPLVDYNDVENIRLYLRTPDSDTDDSNRK